MNDNVVYIRKQLNIRTKKKTEIHLELILIRIYIKINLTKLIKTCSMMSCSNIVTMSLSILKSDAYRSIKKYNYIRKSFYLKPN